MTIEAHDLDPRTGELPGVQVVGFHGELDFDQTPARSQPVWIDAEQRMLSIIEPGRLQRHAKLSTPPPGKCWVERPSEAKIPATGPLPGVGTRVGPWPAKHGWLVATLGPRELGILDGLRVDVPDALTSRVDAFLEWLRMDIQHPQGLHCERRDGLVHWYCAAADEMQLRTRIRLVAIKALIRDAQGPSPIQLQKTSYWLARAATNDEDVYRAAAGLLRALGGPSPRVDSLLTTLVHRRDKAETASLLALATRWLNEACKASPVPSASYAATTRPLTRYRDTLRNRAMSTPAGAQPTEPHPPA